VQRDETVSRVDFFEDSGEGGYGIESRNLAAEGIGGGPQHSEGGAMGEIYFKKNKGYYQDSVKGGTDDFGKTLISLVKGGNAESGSDGTTGNLLGIPKKRGGGPISRRRKKWRGLNTGRES